MIEFMEYNWKNDCNYSVKTKEDLDLLDQLPIDVRLRIFHDFLYRDFFNDYSSFFRFKIKFQGSLDEVGNTDKSLLKIRKRSQASVTLKQGY